MFLFASATLLIQIYKTFNKYQKKLYICSECNATPNEWLFL